MPHQTQLSSVQLLIKEKLYPWLLHQLPRRKEHPKEFLLRLIFFLYLPEHKTTLYFDNFALYNFRPEFSNHQSPQTLPMPNLLVRSSPFSFLLRTTLFIGIYPLLVICRGNIGESNCGEFFPSTCFKSDFTKGPAIFPPKQKLQLHQGFNHPLLK
jgi:hypothetical protein